MDSTAEPYPGACVQVSDRPKRSATLISGCRKSVVNNTPRTRDGTEVCTLFPGTVFHFSSESRNEVVCGIFG